jgi:hypothetical protein
VCAISEHEDDSTPRTPWPKHLRDVGGALAFLFVLLWVVVVFADQDLRSRLEAAGGAVAAVAAIAAAAAALIALRQLELQRVALDEQRHALGAQRFQTLRDAYAVWLECLTEAVAASTARSDGDRRRAAMNLSIARQRLSLLDADPGRIKVVYEVDRIVTESWSPKTVGELVLRTVDTSRRLQAFWNGLDFATKAMLVPSEEHSALFDQLHASEDLPQYPVDLLRPARAHLAGIALLCIRAALTLEETTGRAPLLEQPITSRRKSVQNSENRAGNQSPPGTAEHP